MLFYPAGHTNGRDILTRSDAIRLVSTLLLKIVFLLSVNFILGILLKEEFTESLGIDCFSLSTGTYERVLTLSSLRRVKKFDDTLIGLYLLSGE
jgi:hypothetical protein